MKLEDQVCSLELAKKLKELGVKQESYFWWVKKIFANDPPVDPWIILDCQDTHALENISAFTVAELGEMLRRESQPFPKPFKLWDWEWTFNASGQPEGYGTEADARSNLLIYLIEEGLVKP